MTYTKDILNVFYIVQLQLPKYLKDVLQWEVIAGPQLSPECRHSKLRQADIYYAGLSAP